MSRQTISVAPVQHREEREAAPVAAAPNGAIVAASPENVEEAEILQASIKAGSVAQIVVASIAVVGLIYLLKLVLITTLTALLLAFVAEPAVNGLTGIGVRRWAGSLISVAAMLALAAALTFFFYNRAVDFASVLPKYSGKIRDSL